MHLFVPVFVSAQHCVYGTRCSYYSDVGPVRDVQVTVDRHGKTCHRSRCINIRGNDGHHKGSNRGRRIQTVFLPFDKK